MRSADYYLTAGRGETITVIPFGDIHWGSSACDTDGVIFVRDMIKNGKNTYWIGMGDMIEAINISDKRFDERQVDERYHSVYSNLVTEQRRDLTKILKPIAGKCLGILSGNHEDKVRTRYHTDHHTLLCEDLGVLNMTDTGFVNLHFQRKGSSERHCINIFVAHGAGGGGTIGAYVNKMHRLVDSFTFHIALMGHAHKRHAFEMSNMSASNACGDRRLLLNKQTNLAMKFGDLNQKMMKFGGTGSFFKAYPISKPTNSIRGLITSYAEKKLYTSASLGVITVTITPFMYSGNGVYKPEYYIEI